MKDPKPVPYSKTVFLLGIFSLLTAAFIVGGISAVFVLIYAKKSKQAYLKDPSLYKTLEYVKTGKRMSIIAIIMASIILCLWLFSLITK